MTRAAELASIPRPEIEPGDPFASDVFGSNNSSETLVDVIDLAQPSDEEGPVPWMTRLPKLSQKLLESSLRYESLPAKLPERLSKAIADAFHEILFTSSTHVDCELESISECDLYANSTDPSLKGNLAIQIIFEPTQSNALVIVSRGFVRRMIDRIFGSSEYESSNKISPIEIAISEFLAARVVARINDAFDNEYFSVGEVSLMPTELFVEHESGAGALVEIRTEASSQVLEVLISRGFLSGLKNSSLLDSDEERAAKLFRTVLAIPLRAQIGSTQLEVATLSFLEPGDVVLIEESQLEWNQGSPRGELRLFAGAGSNIVLTGKLLSEKNTESDTLRVLLKDISSRDAYDPNFTGELFMKEKKASDAELEIQSRVNENGAEDQESLPPSLENLQLRLRVELTAKRVSLREINSLHVGQVLDLGRGPTDSVNLVTDGSDETVATGELVDIDGRLGVRLTKVFL